jgi:hypothetical protein
MILAVADGRESRLDRCGHLQRAQTEHASASQMKSAANSAIIQGFWKNACATGRQRETLLPGVGDRHPEA